MSLQTAFTEMMSLRHPITLAPMGGFAGGALTAAVSNAGGLGLVGAGRSAGAGWLERELEIVKAETSQPWGIGFQAWGIDESAVEWALDWQPHAVMLSFGDPTPFAARVHDAGVPLFVQVTDMSEAQQAIDVGADVIVAQGSEAGGHGSGARSTLPFVPAVVDLAAPTPVLAAGGIADGRGVAAALVLGAAGALVGTRFQTAQEALIADETQKELVKRLGEDTQRTRILDIARRSDWPAAYSARVLTNAFLEQWRGREEELAADTATQEAYLEAASRNDLDVVSVWASEALDLITDVSPAGEIVEQLAADAHTAFARALTPERH